MGRGKGVEAELVFQKFLVVNIDIVFYCEIKHAIYKVNTMIHKKVAANV